MSATMTSLERTLTTLGHKEPDRVPLFLLTTMHGAKELGVSIKEYYSRAETVIRGQIALQKKYGGDCYYPFFYAAAEVEAWSGDVIYIEDGPPNAGRPFIRSFEEIESIFSDLYPARSLPEDRFWCCKRDDCPYQGTDCHPPRVRPLAPDTRRPCQDRYGRCRRECP